MARLITNLTPASALTGTELAWVEQGGLARKTTTQDIADLGGGSEVNDLSSIVTWANIPIANVPTGITGSTVAFGNHAHAGVYEPVDATIVRTGDAAWNASDWDTAFGWGDWAGHTHSAFDRVTSVLSGANVFSDVVVVDGITTAIATRALTASDVGAAATSHNHDAGDITTGILAVLRGGTGVAAGTGSGNNVLSASPTFSGTVVMPLINATAGVVLQYNGTSEFQTQDSNAADRITGAAVKHWDGSFYDVGMARMPKVNFTAATTVSDTHWHKRLVHNGTADATLALTFNTEDSQPDDVVMWVMAKNGPVTLVDGTMVLSFYAGTGAPAVGDITIARGGWATIVKDGDSAADVTGVGLS